MNLDGRTFSGISDHIPVLAMLNVQSKQHHLTNLTSKSLAWHKIFPESLKVYETEVNQQLEWYLEIVSPRISLKLTIFMCHFLIQSSHDLNSIPS